MSDTRGSFESPQIRGRRRSARRRRRKFQIDVTRERAADLISRGQILDFEFHLSRRHAAAPRRRLPLARAFIPRRFSSQLTSDLYILALCLYLIPLISHSTELRDYEFFSTSRPLPPPPPPGPFFPPPMENFTSRPGNIAAIFLAGFARDIENSPAREMTIRSEILGPLLYK